MIFASARVLTTKKQYKISPNKIAAQHLYYMTSTRSVAYGSSSSPNRAPCNRTFRENKRLIAGSSVSASCPRISQIQHPREPNLRVKCALCSRAKTVQHKVTNCAKQAENSLCCSSFPSAVLLRTSTDPRVALAVDLVPTSHKIHTNSTDMYRHCMHLYIREKQKRRRHNNQLLTYMIKVRAI